MIALDTNLLVYAHKRGSPFHAKAGEVIHSLRNGPGTWAIPWPCIHEFVGIVTHPRIYLPPSTLAEALGFVESLVASPRLQLLAESPGYLERLEEVARAGRIKGPRIHDARIAALCLHHGVRELWSADRNTSAFPRLKVSNPLLR